jgi:NAD(P)-dependent dehydrogenase (short-subunit alcohol dehydrogenase family)
MSTSIGLSLAGRTILVTGGTQGIGEAIALAAAAAGARGIAITGRNSKRGVAVAKAIEKAGATAHFVAGDLANEADCRRIVTDSEAALGTIDGLVNAAGLTDRGTLEETTVALWDLLFAVNVRAPFILTQEVARRLQAKRKPGAIVNIITRSSHGGQPFLTAYSASKGALATLTKNNAHALREHRIRVNGLNIGWAETPGEHAIQKRDGKPKDWLERAEPNQPFGRLIKPRDVAIATVYLLSDASEMMTGANIDFDQNPMGAYD